MNSRTTVFLFAAGLLASAASAQTQPGSANAVDPYAPSQTPNATTSKPAIQPGTDTPVTTPVNTKVQVDAARFARMDRDTDGRVSLAEFTAGYTEAKLAGANPGGTGAGTDDAAVVFKQLDADNDTYLSATELANADYRR